jgi:CRISPR-associated endoribonuclease Cas6
MSVVILDRHCNYGSNAGEDEDHGGDDRAVAQADQFRRFDPVAVRVRSDDALDRDAIEEEEAGLVGRALLSDIPEPLWPYLILGQWVHPGKSASFGLGRYFVLPQAEPAPKQSR